MNYCYSPTELFELLDHTVRSARMSTAPAPELARELVTAQAPNPLSGRYVVVQRPLEGLTYMVLAPDHFEFSYDPEVVLTTPGVDDAVRAAADLLLARMRAHYNGLPRRN